MSRRGPKHFTTATIALFFSVQALPLRSSLMGRRVEAGIKVEEEGDCYTYRYTVTITMTPVLR